MKLAFLKKRSTVNRAIVASVATHLFAVILANRFPIRFFTDSAFYSAIALYFVAGPVLWLWHRTTRPAVKRESLTDIREATAQMQALQKYDPIPFFDAQKGLFVGLNIDTALEPLYAPWSKFRKTHMQIVGTTGSGKGVATTMMLAQCALADECVVIFDPKFPGDEFAPRVLYKLARDHGIPFYLINLSPTMPPPFDKEFPQTPPQINIFRDCTTSELEELLTTAFDLSDQGGSADHYRLHDRIACKDVCQRATTKDTKPTIHELVSAANKSRKIDDEKGADFKAKLEEIAELPALNTSEGCDLKGILDQNAILYIIGSTRNAQVTRVQKMLLLRLLQLIERRDRNTKLRPVAMMLDELKYLLSTGVLQALGTVRDKGCHVMLAHQTNGDLRDCGGLDPEAVSSAVKVNTSLKLIYRATDEDDAEWASGLSGTIVVQQKSAHMQQAMFHAGEGQFRDLERPYLTINDLLALPDMTGMLFGLGLSKRIQVSPMPFGPSPKITPATPIVKKKTQPADEENKTQATPEVKPAQRAGNESPSAAATKTHHHGTAAAKNPPTETNNLKDLIELETKEPRIEAANTGEENQSATATKTPSDPSGQAENPATATDSTEDPAKALSEESQPKATNSDEENPSLAAAETSPETTAVTKNPPSETLTASNGNPTPAASATPTASNENGSSPSAQPSPDTMTATTNPPQTSGATQYLNSENHD